MDDKSISTQSEQDILPEYSIQITKNERYKKYFFIMIVVVLMNNVLWLSFFFI